eukprot:GHVN01066873.1.p2 GENE.GHVN01066873.1~~GHVN01066873.1.p2  ORF type:complete len:443 (+),score=27.39 GHVN01066873.1:2920-4248(+)
MAQESPSGRLSFGDPKLGLEDPLRTSSRLSALEAIPLGSGHDFHGVAEVLTPVQFTIGIVATMLGVSIVSIPKGAILCGGVVPLCIALCFLGTLAYMSAVSLIRTTEISGGTTVEAVGKVAIKNDFVRVLSSEFSLVFLISLGLTAYTHMVANILDSFFGLHGIQMSKYVTLFIAVIAMSVLCFLRSYSSLKIASNLTTIAFLVTAFIIVWKSLAYKGGASPDLPPVTIGSTMLGCCQLSTAFLAHFNIPGMYAELQRKSKPNAEFYMALSFAGTILLFCNIGFASYYMLGGNVGDDMLKTLADLYENKDKVLLSTQFVVGTGLILKTPLLNFPIKTVMLGLLGEDVRECSAGRNAAVTLASRALIYAMAIALTRIDLVLQIAGATSGAMILLISPAMYGLSLEKGTGPFLRNMTLMLAGISLVSFSLFFFFAENVWSQADV